VALSVWLIIWPNNLHMFRTISPPSSFWDIWIVGGLIGTTFFTYLGYRLRKNKRLPFFYFWIIIVILPSFYTFRMHSYWCEHWLTVALPGVFVLWFYFLERVYLFKVKSNLQKIFFLFVVVTPFVFYATKTIERNVEWENPVKFYETNIQRQGIGSIIYNNLGRAYFDAGEYDKAAKVYQKALEVNPTMYQAQYNLGNLYLRLSHLDKALVLYRQVLVIRPQFIPAHHNIAVIYDKKGDDESAINFLETTSLKVFPTPPFDILYDLTVFSLKNGQMNKARYYFDKIYERNPNNPSVLQLKKMMK
jgi:tetratricopeptide (TPR) repeat protein